VVADLFQIQVSPLELILRGSVIYWFLLLVFRFLMRRDLGAVGSADVLLIVLVADASQNAMVGESTTVAEGLVVVCTLLGWNWLLDMLSYRFPVVARLTGPPPLLLVRRGRVVHRNLRREHITLDELKGHLRQHGIEHLQEVRMAYLEGDGQFSVIREKAAADSANRPARLPGA
jgi:uncharacterized membrane protein YcaP (DUF421 family)